MLQGKKILIGITGSIAAYKSILLVRMLVKEGAEVKVVITDAAKSFVSPLVLSTLSKQEVITGLVNDNNWANHVMLGRWADVFIIAPATCNTIAKMANGLCDNVLLAIYLSATCPVVIAPAMDEDMWMHATTKHNIERLKSYGNYVLTVGNGELASGLVGEGRLEEPENIINFIKCNFFRLQELANKKVIITAGPTHEAIDPVRYIGNNSSGKMGFAIAEVLYEHGANVILITGPTKEKPRYNNISVIKVASAQEMYNAANEHFPSAQIAIFAAAVADYTIKNIALEKIKKQPNEDYLHLELTKTIDILGTLGNTKKNQFVVGFALETNNELENAKQKLLKKNANMIVLNSLQDKNAGFGYDTNKVTILKNDGTNIQLPLMSKYEVAINIVKQIINEIND